jgi:hypothetical protein
MDEHSHPPVAIRRWSDPCFHVVDEVVEEGYILGSVLVPHEDVVETRVLDLDEAGRPIPLACAPRARVGTIRHVPKDGTQARD